MTDKVQKTLSEIQTRKLCTMDEHMAFYNDNAKEDYRLLSEIEELIKALQEEPVRDTQSPVIFYGLTGSVDSPKEEPSKFDAAIQEGDDVRYNEDLGCRVNLSQLKRVAKKEEPVSEDLEEAAKRYATEGDEISGLYIIDEEVEAFKAGAKWQKESLWKPAAGNDLPEYEREVVVFTQDFPNDAGIMKVAIAHRPNPKGFDGKSLLTGKVEHYTPMAYGKGGWNIPDVK